MNRKVLYRQRVYRTLCMYVYISDVYPGRNTDTTPQVCDAVQQG